jgi:hypothetical protein
MAITEWELWACADELIRRHGNDAAVKAAVRTDELLREGDLDGAATWQAILKRIEELQAPPPGPLN